MPRISVTVKVYTEARRGQGEREFHSACFLSRFLFAFLCQTRNAEEQGGTLYCWMQSRCLLIRGTHSSAFLLLSPVHQTLLPPPTSQLDSILSLVFRPPLLPLFSSSSSLHESAPPSITLSLDHPFFLIPLLSFPPSAPLHLSHTLCLHSASL